MAENEDVTLNGTGQIIKKGQKIVEIVSFIFTRANALTVLRVISKEITHFVCYFEQAMPFCAGLWLAKQRRTRCIFLLTPTPPFLFNPK